LLVKRDAFYRKFFTKISKRYQYTPNTLRRTCSRYVVKFDHPYAHYFLMIRKLPKKNVLKTHEKLLKTRITFLYQMPTLTLSAYYMIEYHRLSITMKSVWCDSKRWWKTTKRGKLIIFS